MIRLIAFVLFLLTSVTAHAVESSRQIGWENLIPPEKPIDNPILKLDEDTRFDLGVVVSYRADLRLGFIEKGSDEYNTMLQVEKSLKDKGVDIDAMLEAIERMEAEFERRGEMTVKELDGQVVRLPGYALPLEFSEDGVTEFLLVPYVGACIHTPPPPPNQIVFVKMDKKYLSKSLYDPVWITGQIKIQAASRALTFVDGTADVATGYTINAVTIEPYQ